MVGAFTSGMSNERWVRYEYVDPYSTGLLNDDGCSHGNRVASGAVAPRDGTGPVGVAWKANLVSVRFDDDVLDFSVTSTVDAVYKAGSLSNIIAMAWGSSNWLNSVEAAIEDVYYGSQALFIGAAGTSSCNNPLRPVIFPASMEEVVAVTATGATGNLNCDAHYGPKVLLTAAVRTPTAGTGTDVLGFQGSSNATSIIAGAAAAAWQYLGGWTAATRDQVVQRLVEGADFYPNRDSDLGYGEINLARSLGAIWYTSVDGCNDEDGDCDFHYKLDQCTLKTYSISHKGGTGPFTYRWHDGSTATSTTLEICPEPYQEVVYGVSGGVTDQSDGNTMSRTVTIYVTHSNPDFACSTCAQ